ncbi:MAG TPA: hypothetical protein VNL74_03975 [Methylococcus sp.]|nr:hypothetical protein [Methylococcus sp.]
MPTVVLASGTAWVVPHGVTQLDSVECWGGGAPGNQNGEDIGSGGAGAYARTNNLPVTPNQTCYYRIPAQRSPGAADPEDTWFNKDANQAPTSTSQGCLAKSGKKSTGQNGGPGGLASQCIGDVAYNGGNGNYSALAGNRGGSGGGGAASNQGAGNAGATTTSSTGANGGAAGTGGGAGGTGGPSGGGGNGSPGTSDEDGGGGGGGGGGHNLTNPGAGGDGGTPGGGGGQAGCGGAGNRNDVGGDGARGQIRITYRYATKAVVC